MSLDQQFPELFALHGGTLQPGPGEGMDPAWAEVLATIPPGPGKAALMDLLLITARHPVKLWGQEQEGSWVCGIEADPAWLSHNLALWVKARSLWARSLGVLASHCRQLLEPRP